MQDAAVLVVITFFRRIDSNLRFERDGCARVGRGGYRDGLGAGIRLSLNVEDLFASEAQGFGVLAVQELQRQYAHADQVRAVNSLEALRDDGFDAEQ